MKHTIEFGPNGNFVLGIPNPDGSYHHVAFPATEKGLPILRRLLSAGEPGKLGTVANPVQYDLDKMIREFEEKPRLVETKFGTIDLSKWKL